LICVPVRLIFTAIVFIMGGFSAMVASFFERALTSTNFEHIKRNGNRYAQSLLRWD
jgi:hypothetical protein